MCVCTKVLLRLLQYISLVLYVCVNKNVDIKYMSVCMYVCMAGVCAAAVGTHPPDHRADSGPFAEPHIHIHADNNGLIGPQSHLGRH